MAGGDFRNAPDRARSPPDYGLRGADAATLVRGLSEGILVTLDDLRTDRSPVRTANRVDRAGAGRTCCENAEPGDSAYGPVHTRKSLIRRSSDNVRFWPTEQRAPGRPTRCAGCIRMCVVRPSPTQSEIIGRSESRINSSERAIVSLPPQRSSCVSSVRSTPSVWRRSCGIAADARSALLFRCCRPGTTLSGPAIPPSRLHKLDADALADQVECLHGVNRGLQRRQGVSALPSESAASNLGDRHEVEWF